MTGTEGGGSGGEDPENLEARRKGYARNSGGSLRFLSAMLFETDWLMKGYAGGLGASASRR